MTNTERMLHAFETEMIPKIYGFCRLKMSKSEDAEDMAQEICLEVLRAIQRGKQIDNLNAFVWSVSRHVFYNTLRRKRRRVDTVAFVPDYIADDADPEADYIRMEQTQLLHRELAHMTGNYRQAVILHYFDGRSCEQIAEALGRSVGTVKWWLHDAREAIKKGMDLMREYGEKSYRPGRLMMSCTGLPGANGEPMSCAARKSAQNILLSAYKRPVTAEELCTELGISAPYIEDEVENLVQNGLLRAVAGNRYQTDFVIIPPFNPTVIDGLKEAVASEYYEILTAFLARKEDELLSPALNPCGYSRERLLWVYIHLFTAAALERLKYKHNVHVKYDDIPLRPNGGKWIAYGYDQDAVPKDVEWKDYYPFDGPIHKVDGVFAQGFFHTWSGTDSSPYFEVPNEALALGGRIVMGKADPDTLCEEDKYLFSVLLEKKLFVKEDGGYRPTFYFVPRAGLNALYHMAEELSERMESLFLRAKDIVWTHFAPNVPPGPEAQMGNLLSNYFYPLITCTYATAVKNGTLTPPAGDGKLWISLIVSE